MVLTAAVVGFNLVLAGVCFWGAWRCWQMCRQLAQLTQQLDEALSRSNRLRAWRLPELILHGRQSTANLRRQQLILQRQLGLLGQVFTVVGWLRFRLRQRSLRRR